MTLVIYREIVTETNVLMDQWRSLCSVGLLTQFAAVEQDYVSACQHMQGCGHCIDPILYCQKFLGNLGSSAGWQNDT